MLPRRVPKPGKRSLRWRSTAHRDWIRGFACCVCGSSTNIEVAHVRMNSGAGIGQKPDDWRTVPLCAGPNSNADRQLGCHNRQHIVGEPTFWAGTDIEALLNEFAAASPKAREIADKKRERELA